MVTEFERELQAATDSWLVRWELKGRPDVLPWDMLVTIPKEAFHGEPGSFYDLNWHVYVAYQSPWYCVETDIPVAKPLPAGVWRQPLPPGLIKVDWQDNLPRYKSKNLGPIRALLQELAISCQGSD